MQKMLHKIRNFFWKSRLFLNGAAKKRAAERRRIPEGVFASSFIINNAQPGEKCKYVPVGAFPLHPDGAHELTREKLEEMVDNLTSDVMIDLGHDAIWNPGAEAFGWIARESFEVRADGLYADYPDFTADATELVANRKYRFLSPAYELEALDKQGRDLGARLHPISLTNSPYFDTEIDALRNSKSKEETQTEESAMDYTKEFKIKLGLTDEATDEEVETKLDELVDAGQKIADEGAEEEEKKVAEAVEEKEEAEIAANSALGKRLQELEDKEKTRNEAGIKERADTLVNAAIASWKITPAEKDVYVNSALHDYDGTKKRLDGVKENAVKPGVTLPVTNDEDSPLVRKNSTIKNAVEFMKAQGRNPG